MNHAEEQKSELEAISEIYYNEIKVKSNEPPISFSICVRPQASCYQESDLANGGDDDDDDDDSDASQNDAEEAHTGAEPSIELQFDLPLNYPDVKPSIQVVDSQNLEEDQIEELLDILNQKSDESLGAVMIFVIVSDVVEWLSNIAEKEAQEIEQVKIDKLQELEREEKRKIDGTPVTVQTFLAWKAKFEAELLKEKLEQRKQQTEPGSTGQRRLTGKEMFETDKALAESDLNFVEELEQEQLEALMQNIDEVELDDGSDDDNDDYKPDSDAEELDDEDFSDDSEDT